MDQCPTCGVRIPATPAGTPRPTHCRRCGDPLPAPSNAVTVTLAPDPDVSGPSTAEPAATASAEPAPPPAGPRLPAVPGYEVLEVIGRGGMGLVYKARQASPRRVVALKMIPGVPGRADRFKTEVAAVARLNHPNIVRIHEVGDLGGRPFFSMEYVPGGTLGQRLAGRPLPAVAAARLVARLARAVQHAHDRGIVHRDLKPGNVLLAPGDEADTAIPPAVGPDLGLDGCVPKIADFGLAKHLDGSAGGVQTQSGAVLGTPSYMAPEQARGRTKEIGPAVDVYALGAILYEGLTGEPPFRGDAQFDTLMKVISDDPVPPRRLRPDLPRDVEVICLKCLRKDPRQRYRTAGELADDLDRFAAGRPIAARPRTTRERAAGWLGRRREYAFLAAGVVLAGGLAVALLAWWPRPVPVPGPPAPDPAANLPPDLRLVPPDAFAFATVRAADVWAHPAARELFAHAATLGPDVTLDGLGQEVERVTSIPPGDIERATFVLPDEKGDPLIVLATAEPYDHDRLRKMLTDRGRHEVQELREGQVFVPTVSKRDMGYFLASDRVLVLGDSDLVVKVAMGGRHGTGPLTPSLERAGRTHTLVVGMSPSAGTVGEVFTRLKIGPEADPAGKLRSLGLAADVGHPDGPGGRLAVDLSGWVTYPTGGDAEAARPHLPAVLRSLLAPLERSRGTPFPPEFVAPLLAPIKAAEWERDGEALRASARVEVDLAAVKAQMTDAVTRSRGESNLRRIAQAMRQYHDKHGRFPPAVVTDAAGKPLYSWRVLLLPHLGGESVYRRFHLNRAWDHPSNRPLLDQMPAAFAAGTPAGNATPYQVLTGPGGLFDTPEGRGLADVTDGTGQTILLVEAGEAVPWSKPADVAFDPARPPKLGGSSAAGFNVVTADGTVRFIPHPAASPALLRGLFTRSGGEAVVLP